MVARVMAVADIYDALVTDRPYRRGMPQAKALAILQEESQTGKLDPRVVAELVQVVGDREPRAGNLHSFDGPETADSPELTEGLDTSTEHLDAAPTHNIPVGK